MSRRDPRTRSGLFWAGVYLSLALAPLALALVRTSAGGRSFGVELGIGLGFAGLAMMGLQFALTARFRWIGRGLGLDDLMQVHRQAGLIGGAFVLAHPLVLIAAQPRYLSFLDPRVNLPRSVALGGAIVAVALLWVLPLARKRLGIAYERWRLGHALLASYALLIGLAHVMRVGYYVSEPWRRAIWIAMTGGAFLLLLYSRGIRPLAIQRRPWRLREVRFECERVWTLVFEAEGHEGLRFAPGQFVWMTLGASAFSLQQHPFTIASSAEISNRMELTVKELGDFTRSVGHLSPGARAHLEGPYGNFTVDGIDAASVVFIAGGIGITPAMSMLRTFRDRGDRRAFALVHGSETLDKAVFRDEIEGLRSALVLEVIHVLEKPPPGWTGETGHVTREVLERRLDLHAAGAHYFVCGPGPMMDGVEVGLRAAGVPAARIHCERFEIV